MNIPDDLYYTLTHEWVRFTDRGTALVGLTDPAQNLLSTLMFINLRDTGAPLSPGEPAGEAESMKAVKAILSPLAGRIVAVNEQAMDQPDLVNLKPYDTWLIELDDVDGADRLVEPERYRVLVTKGE